MFNSYKTYNVYVKRDTVEPLETAVFVPDTFSIWAFIFTLFWALYHRLWILSTVILGLTAALMLLNEFNLLSEDMMNVGSMMVSVWVGFDGNAWREAALERRGYVLYDIVTGQNEQDAQRRFFDREALQRSQHSLARTPVPSVQPA